MCVFYNNDDSKKKKSLRRHLGVRFSPTHVLIFFAFCVYDVCAQKEEKKRANQSRGTKFDEKQRIIRSKRRRQRLVNETDQGSSFRLLFYARKLPRAQLQQQQQQQRGEKKRNPLHPPLTFAVPRIFVESRRRKNWKTCQLIIHSRQKKTSRYIFIIERARVNRNGREREKDVLPSQFDQFASSRAVAQSHFVRIFCVYFCLRDDTNFPFPTLLVESTVNFPNETCLCAFLFLELFSRATRGNRRGRVRSSADERQE